MRRLVRILSTAVIVILAVVIDRAQSAGPLLLETPTISQTRVAFSNAGHIWIVGRGGGDAQRLTANPAREINPVFSPDGSQVAFARFNPAAGPLSWDVYVVSVHGGEERRLTYHPDLDFPVNWTPDGKSVVILSFRQRTSLVVGSLFTVPAAGGFPKEIPVPRGWAASFSPSGDRIAYTPLIKARELFAWRNYRGGGTSRIWLTTLSDAAVEIVPHLNANDTDPMWIGEKVYFVSDRDGTENLFVYDTRLKTVAQLTRFERYGIKSAAANGDAIVFNQGGALNVFDIKTGQYNKIAVRLLGDFPETKTRKIDTTQWLSSVGLSRDGRILLFGIRGEIFKASIETGAVENITNTPSAAERNPIQSPDGESIAYLSDESGEQQMFLRDPKSGVVRRVSLSAKPSFYGELQWSPDSKKLVFSDAHLKLWYFDLERNSSIPVDAAKYTDGDTAFQPAWSPDSRWLVYSKFGVNRVRSITLYSLETRKTFTATTPHIDAQSPTFDLNGKYLYFIGSNRTGLVESQGMSGFPFRTQVTRSLYAIVLNRNDPSPLSQDNEAATKAGPVEIDLDNIGQRVVPLPFWPTGGNRIMAGPPGVLFIVEGSTVQKFVIGKPGLEKFVEGAGLYRVTADGKYLLLRRQGNWAIVDTGLVPKPEDGRFKLDPIEFTLDPRAEWQQMYGEAWRRMREYFYDPNLHGQNFAELQAHSAAYLPNLGSREDLNTLFKEMFSHLSVSHMGVVGGDLGVPQGGVPEGVGLLGADFEVESGRYRIKKIFPGDNTRGINSPLAQPGVNARAGEYILAVDGTEVTSQENLYRFFLNKALKTVELKIGPSPSGQGARTVRVTPVSSEMPLRQYRWVEENRQRVSEMSGGKLGYIYLPDTADAGYNAFNREFYAQLDKDGLIVDGRFNEGGRAADYIIDTLRRVPLQRAALRDAEDIRIPTGVIDGPKVLLTNEMAGSGGDSLPWMWQQTKIGPVVGTRTAGAGVGASTLQLIDGGTIRVPDWGWYDPNKGTWLMENRGVTPDVELEIMPVDWRAGRDPQLEKAVTLAMESLKKRKQIPARRPRFPVYK